MKEKRGQVTIFIIIALLIILVGLFIFLIRPRITTGGTLDVENPQDFIQSCVEDDLDEIVNTISLQGGTYEEPTFFTYYETNKVKYLCYVEENYAPCVRQATFLEYFIEDQINEAIKPVVDSCFRSLLDLYGEKGFSPELRMEQGQVISDFVDSHLVLNLRGYYLTLSKNDQVFNYRSFEVANVNHLKEILGVASDIIEEEILEEEGVYLDGLRINNRDLDISEYKFDSDGTNIYVIKHKKTNDFFQFASRSHVVPPGF